MKELKISIPKGMEIDSQNSDLNKGIIKFKKKEPKQKKWEDFGRVSGYYINHIGGIIKHSETESLDGNQNTFPTFKLAEANIALTQLLQWRNKVWREVNWDGEDESILYSTTNYSVTLGWDRVREKHVCRVTGYLQYRTVLRFPTREIAEKFIEDHLNLINEASPLLS